MLNWYPNKTKKKQQLPKPFLINGFVALVPQLISSLIKEKNSVQKFLTICSKGLAPITLPHRLITHSATAKQKLQIKQLQNTWQVFVTIRLGTLPRPSNVFIQHKFPPLHQKFPVLFNFWNGATTSVTTNTRPKNKILRRIVNR